MASLSAKDRVSLCQFTFSDGRRCRTPRTGKQSRFCFDHAQKEARARAAESLSKDLSYFFSGTYLSACDLSTAMGRLIPAVIRGDVKPKVARTVAYMAQTLLQSIRMSQHEYINAFSTDGWRQSIRNSVNGNHNYRFPPAPESEQPESPQPQPAQPQTQPQHQPPAPQSAETPVNCHSERSDERPTSGASPESYREESASSSNSSLATHLPRPGRGHSSLPQPMPSASAEFAQQVLACLPQFLRSDLVGPTGSLSATPHVQPAPPNPQPAETVTNCHSEPARSGERSDERPTSGASPESYREEPAFSSSAPSPYPAHASAPKSTPSSPSAPPTTTGATSPAPPQPVPQPPASQPAQTPEAPAPQPACPEQNRKVNPREPNRDAPWLHWSPTSNIPPDSKLL